MSDISVASRWVRCDFGLAGQMCFSADFYVVQLPFSGQDVVS